MAAIQMQNHSLKTGYQLERYFNPEKLDYIDGETKRSGKWDHYLKSGTKPSITVLKQVEQEYAWAYNYYTLSLWKVLRSGKQSKIYWCEFYLSLDKKLQRFCYRFKSFMAGDLLKRKSQKSAVLDKLFRIGTPDALACLVALLRESADEDSPFEYDYIETTVFNMIFWIIGEAPFFYHLDEIYTYLVEHIFVKGNDRMLLMRATPWTLTSSDLATRVSINNNNILLAEDIGLISSRSETREFIYWKFKGDSHLIVKEMAEALYTSHYNLPDSKRGLKWLIKKLNKTRKNSRKLSLEII
jgi:hypothetical protein